MLRLEQIEHVYKKTGWSLNPLTVALSQGEILGLIGPNGSGKSTVIKIAAGLLQPLNGTIFLDEHELRHLERREIARQLGYLPQNVSSDFSYTVWEVASLGRFPYQKGIGFLSAEDREIIDQSLHLTNMAELSDRMFNHLSGGERQRALLASVLAQQPQVLLLDEPTAALDLHHKVRFFSLLRSLSSQGMGIMIITHELNLASLYCDRLLLLDHGTMVCQGPVAHVLSEQILHEIYGPDLVFSHHPIHGNPIVLPRRHE